MNWLGGFVSNGVVGDVKWTECFGHVRLLQLLRVHIIASRNGLHNTNPSSFTVTVCDLLKIRHSHTEKSTAVSPHDLADIGGYKIPNELLGVVIDGPALLHSMYNCGEVVVSEDHLRCCLGHSRAGAHCHSNGSLLESGGIIHTISSLLEGEGK